MRTHRPRWLRRPAEASETPALRLAWLATAVVLFCFALIAILNVLALGLHGTLLLASVAGLIVVFAMQVLHSTMDVRSWTPPMRALTLSVQALATYLPFLWLGRVWGGMAGFLAGSVLLVVPGRLGWLLFAAVVLSVLVPPMLGEMDLVDITYLTVSTMLTGVIIHSLRRLATLIAEVQRTRGELASMAVTNERLRIARDLHDLLGYSLSAITLKTELIYRLLPGQSERARGEVAEMLEIARQALADVRAVARNYRDMSLTEEAASAASILSSAEVEVDMDLSCGPMEREVDTIMATVLREAVTNILRHSKAQHCAINAVRVADRVRLTVTNDGVDPLPGEQVSDGSGLGNLSARLEALGGRLTAGISEDGRFGLMAEAPAARG